MIFRRLYQVLCLSAVLAQAGETAPGQPLVLQPLYRMPYGPQAFLSTTNAFASSKPLGQTGYLARNPVPGGKALYRFFNARSRIYRDATDLPAPWAQVELLGYSFPDATNRVQLKEYEDRAGYFLTLNENEVPPVGYQYVRSLGYAFERFGPDLVRFLSLNHGDVEFRFDRICGGALWHIVHNGVQLINNGYYGRQACTALDLWPDVQQERHHIPCDCGLTALVKGWMKSVNFRMGAPCPVFRREQDGAFIRTIPVESCELMSSELGGGALNPVVYSSFQIEKRIQPVLGYHGALQFHLRWNIAAADLAKFQKQRVNICGLHLITRLNQLALYNPHTQVTTPMPDWTKASRNQQFIKYYTTDSSPPKSQMEDYTCVIMHDGEEHAVGLMGASPQANPAGSVQYFLGYFWKQLAPLSDEPPDPEFSRNTIMMTAMSEAVRPGINDYVVYLLVGKLSEVIAYSRGIYLQRQALTW